MNDNYKPGDPIQRPVPDCPTPYRDPDKSHLAKDMTKLECFTAVAMEGLILRHGAIVDYKAAVRIAKNQLEALEGK
jgi:hypothetical protein